MKTPMKLFLTSFLISLAGCGALTEPQKRYDQAAVEMSDVKAIRSQTVKYRFGEIVGGLYVDQVSAQDANKPTWFFDKKSVNLTSIPFSSALANIFYGDSLQFRFPDGVLTEPVTLNLNGTSGQVLDALANYSGYSYTLDDKVITWSRYQYKTFDISMFPGVEKFGVGKGGASGSPDMQGFSTIEQMKSTVIASSDEYAHLEGESDVVKDIEKAMSLVKSPKGQIVVNKSTMSVMVHDLPENISKMEQIMTNYNEMLLRLVAIDMKVINVELNDNYQFGLDWKVVGKELTSRGLDLGSSGSFNPDMTTIDAPIFTLTRTDGQWNGTQALVQALQSQGSVSSKTLPRATTLNNRLVKLRDIQRTNFVLERTITTTANVGTEGSVRQGTVETGFSLYAVPKIVNGDVVVRLTTNISTLLGLDKKSSSTSDSSGDSSNQDVYVEAPRVNDKDFDNTVVIKSGETLVLAGLSTESNNSSQANAGSDVLGTSKSADGKRVETLILITPTILRGRQSM